MTALPQEHRFNPRLPSERAWVAFAWGTSMNTPEETLAALIGRYIDPDEPPPEIPRVSLAEALRLGDDPLHILPYLASIGVAVTRLDDLLQVNDDDTEEEVSCFRVTEGIAVTVVSHGLWLLFEP